MDTLKNDGISGLFLVKLILEELRLIRFEVKEEIRNLSLDLKSCLTHQATTRTETNDIVFGDEDPEVNVAYLIDGKETGDRTDYDEVVGTMHVAANKIHHDVPIKKEVDDNFDQHSAPVLTSHEADPKVESDRFDSAPISGTMLGVKNVINVLSPQNPLDFQKRLLKRSLTKSKVLLPSSSRIQAYNKRKKENAARNNEPDERQSSKWDVNKVTCTYCDKKIRCLADLKRHERVHTGERPFVCHLCPKAFKQHGHLRRHIPTHTVKTKAAGGTPFSVIPPIEDGVARSSSFTLDKGASTRFT